MARRLSVGALAIGEKLDGCGSVDEPLCPSYFRAMSEPWGEDLEGEFTNCPGCGQRINPGDPANLRAIEMVPTPSFGEPNDRTEGIGAVFHAGCFNQSDPNWKLT